MINKKNKKKYTFAILLLLIVSISIGYAIISSSLNINGTTAINNPTWDIHFENIQVKEGSITPTTLATINEARNTVTYAVTLNTPGEFYEFSVDAKNGGTIDGMIESVTSKLNGSVITTLPNYLEYSVTYVDGVTIENNHLLAASQKETYKIHIGFKKDIEVSDLPETAQNLTLSFSVTYKQADNTAEEVIHSESFANDDWTTIAAAVRNDKTEKYHVGDTKEIDMGTFGTHTVRIVNMSTPSECSTEGFSQTACGFVVEFADIITRNRMNPWSSSSHVVGDGNIGGWPASEMRTYVNNDIYNALPSNLKNAIKNTMVVSSHGSTAEETNFISTDKLYLLSTHEVWEDVDGNASAGISSSDTAYNNTRQLDYYSRLNVNTSNYANAQKPENGTRSWWLRSAMMESDNDRYFYYVSASGFWTADLASNTYGVSPAFRIG